MNFATVRTKKGSPLMCVGVVRTKKGASADEMKKCMREVIASAVKTERHKETDRKPRTVVPNSNEEHPPRFISVERTPKSVPPSQGDSLLERRLGSFRSLPTGSRNDDDTFATAQTSFSALDESVRLLPSVSGTACASSDLQENTSSNLGAADVDVELKAIENSREHYEFFTWFVYHLYHMMSACGVLSTRLINAGCSNKLFRRPRPGLYISASLQFLKKNIAFCPFIDVALSAGQWAATITDEREKKIAIQQVTHFITTLALRVSASGTLSIEAVKSLFVEQLAFIFVRFRRNNPGSVFGLVEERSEFGKVKKLTLHVAGETSCNTPAKEQARIAAICVLEQLRKPAFTTSLSETRRGTSIHWYADRVVAATLNVSLGKIQELPKFAGPADQS